MFKISFSISEFSKKKEKEIDYLKMYTHKYASLYIPNWLFVVEYCVGMEKDQANLFSLLQPTCNVSELCY